MILFFVIETHPITVRRGRPRGQSKKAKPTQTRKKPTKSVQNKKKSNVPRNKKSCVSKESINDQMPTTVYKIDKKCIAALFNNFSDICSKMSAICVEMSK